MRMVLDAIESDPYGLSYSLQVSNGVAALILPALT
jgi:hypothetical protein